MAILPPVFKQRYFTAAGIPLAGGKIHTYIAGTTTPQTTYTNATESSANTNPIILDANGECDLWLGSSSYKIVLSDSADVVQWTQDNVNQGTVQSLASADYVENLGLVCSETANALTINIKTADGSVPSLGAPVRLGFRSSSLASGLVSLVEIQSPLAMTVSAGSTLGHTSGVDLYVYVYAINYNGVAELAVSGTIYQENDVVSTTAEGAAGGADTLATIYSIQARTNVPIRLIGRLTSNQATAGQWATMPSEIQTGEESRRAEINTTQIANLAVTKPKLAALGQQIGSTSSNFSTSSTTYVDVTNLTATITTTGRPVWIGLQADGDDTQSSNVGGTVGSGDVVISFQILRGSTSIYISNIQVETTSYFLPPGVIWHIDTPSAGTYTYKIQTKVDSGDSPTSRFSYAKLIAYEL